MLNHGFEKLSLLLEGGYLAIILSYHSFTILSIANKLKDRMGIEYCCFEGENVYNIQSLHAGSLQNTDHRKCISFHFCYLQTKTVE